MRKDAYWPALALCEELHKQGFGQLVLDLLAREEVLAPASRSDRRPSVHDHLATIRARSSLEATSFPLVLVDDVISAGATAMACASRLREIYPGNTPILSFAAARTRSGLESIPSVVDPFVGCVRCRGDQCSRSD